MKYALEDLLRVRRFREDKAAAEVVESREQLADAESQLEQRRQELQDHLQWRLRREEELYQEIMQREVHLKDLEDVKSRVQVMRDKDQSYQEKVITAKKKVDDAQRQLDTAREAHLLAVRNREKLDEHKSMWLDESHQELEAKAETEMEDFQVKPNTILGSDSPLQGV